MLLLLLACPLARLIAQDTRISGTVTDQQQQPIVAATVSLLTPTDSSWIASTLTGEQGEFLFSHHQPGTYLLSIHAHGYKPFVDTVSTNAPRAISLTPYATTLQEVVVKSDLPTLRSEPGKLIVAFNDKTIPAGTSLLDLLRKAPGVTVDGSGNISMNGRGVLVMIDDKQTYLSGDDLVNYLRSLPADKVAELVLMDQPPARYDAEGNAGIINIKTRQQREKGLAGNLNLAAGQGYKPRTSNSGNISYSKANLQLEANLGFYAANGFLRQQQTRTTRDPATNHITTTAFQKTSRDETFSDLNLQLKGSYTHKEKLRLTLTALGIYHPNRETGHTDLIIDDHTTTERVFSRSDYKSGFLRRNFNLGLSTRYEVAKDHSLSLDADYLVRSQQDHQQLTTRNLDENLQELPDALNFRSNFPVANEVAVVRIDYTGALPGNFTLEAGLKSSHITNLNDSWFYVNHSGLWQIDTTRTNSYSYNEMITAAYASATKKFSDRWHLQLGLRAEHTGLNIDQKVNSQSIDRSFLSLFPTGLLSYKPDEKHRLELSLGRRVHRPSYYNLNPFAFYVSEFQYRSGNPYLLPSFRNLVTFKHSFKNTVFTELAYAKVFNTINELTFYDPFTNALHNQPHNYADKHHAHLTATWVKKLRPWWTYTVRYAWYFNEYQEDETYLASSHGHSIQLSNQFSYKGWSIDTLYIFNSGDLQGLSDRNDVSHWSEASVSKKVLGDAGVVKLSASDPFGIYRYRPTIEWQSVETHSITQFATQHLTLGFSYTFGNTASRKGSDRQQAEELQRM